MFKAQNCVGCGNCEVVCPTGASDLSIPGKIDHSKCIACGKCVDVCYHRALEMTGKWTTVDELIKELYKDFNIHVIEAKRNINANGKKRGKVEEVIITNYENKRGFEE